MQNIWEDIHGRNPVPEDPFLRALFMKQHPGLPGVTTTEFSHIPTPKSTPENNSKLLLAGSIVAGAMLLWGASKLGDKQVPMASNQVNGSMYGNQGMPQDGQSQFAPSPIRVAQNNNGYSNNISVESTSTNGVDYRGSVNTITGLARMSMGGNVRSSVHIVDDSARMDSESVRRAVNRQLSL
jgi:hypothetical protein